MSHYDLEIQRALDNAPAVYLDQSQPLATGNSGFEEHFKDTTDYTPVSWNIGETAVSEGNKIIVPTLGELAILQQEIASAAGFTDTDYLRELVQHEGEHAGAGQALQAGRIALGVNLWKVYSTQASREHRIAWQPFARIMDLETTRLGLAAIFVRPIKPSEGDVIDLNSVGYEGVDEVGSKVSEHNRTHNDQIPVPRSYRPSNKTHIPLLG